VKWTKVTSSENRTRGKKKEQWDGTRKGGESRQRPRDAESRTRGRQAQTRGVGTLERSRRRAKGKMTGKNRERRSRKTGARQIKNIKRGRDGR